MERPLDKSFSVVIEWENARLSELKRARRMLEVLRSQIAEIGLAAGNKPEVLILYDQSAINPDVIQSSLPAAFDVVADVRILPTEGLRYYELKNYGARQTDSDIVIFLDSDVIPEPKWLEGILGAFERPDVDVVCGNTYMSLDTLLNRSFALFWFFPLRSENCELRKSVHFFANNVGFRRHVIDTFPFPDLPQFRGQCLALAKQLVDNNVGLFIQESSRAEHPAPNGLKHFLVRALCQGHDDVASSVRNGYKPNTTIKGNIVSFWNSVKQSVRNILRNHRKAGLGYVGAMAATVIAFTYYFVKFVGAAVTCLNPGYIRNHFRV